MPTKVDGNPLAPLSERTIHNAGVAIRRASDDFLRFMKSLAEARELWAWVNGAPGDTDSGMSFTDACDDLGANPDLLHDSYLNQMPDGFAPMFTIRDDFLCPFIPTRRCVCQRKPW